MAEYYTSIRLIDDKPRKVIMDKTGNIVNRNPSKEELKDIEKEKHINARNRLRKHICYNETNTCDKCREEGKETKLITGFVRRQRDKNGEETGGWTCISCYQKDYNIRPGCGHDLKKSLRNHRTGNLDPKSTQAKGDMGEELLCRWKGFTNLNKKYDNYNSHIDCIDKNTGSYYQAKIAYYDLMYNRWPQNFKNICSSIMEGFRFRSLFLFCISNDGKIVERVYEISEKEIISRQTISIHKIRGISAWHDRYRILDENELLRLNEIWEFINDNVVR